MEINYFQCLLKIKLPSFQALVKHIAFIMGLSINKAFKKKSILESMEKRKYSYMLFLIVLIALKVSAIQIYLHDCTDERNVNDCELCENAIHNQNLKFSTPQQFQGFEIDIIPFFSQLESHYDSICMSIPINDTYFGRPPPPQNKESLNKYYPFVTRL